MSLNINKVALAGNLGADAELRYMPNGNAVANCRLATKESWKDDKGDWQDKTEWHNLTVYGKLAEIVGDKGKKGVNVYCEGKIQTRKWQDKDGKDRYTTEIVVSEFKVIAPSASTKTSAAQGQPGKQEPTPSGEPVEFF